MSTPKRQRRTVLVYASEEHELFPPDPDACRYCGEIPRRIEGDQRSFLRISPKHKRTCFSAWLQDMIDSESEELHRHISAHAANAAGRSARILTRYGRQLLVVRAAVRKEANA